MKNFGEVERAFYAVVENHFEFEKLTEDDIRRALQSLKDVYQPDIRWSSKDVNYIANFDDPAFRCAYVHKNASFHTKLTAEMFGRAVQHDTHYFRRMIANTNSLKICSLGGGPGCDVLGCLLALSQQADLGHFRSSATVIDIMRGWNKTFSAVVEELRRNQYVSECFDREHFQWSYMQGNLLNQMTNEHVEVISSADLITMVKFVSATASSDTQMMIKKIFDAMKPGSLILYIENAGGGFHQMTSHQAGLSNMTTFFGPLKHQIFAVDTAGVKRFGRIPASETRVTVHIWRKSSQNRNFFRRNRNTFANMGPNVQPEVSVNIAYVTVEPEENTHNQQARRGRGTHNRSRRGNHNRRRNNFNRNRSSNPSQNYSRVVDDDAERGWFSDDDEEEHRECCVIL